MKANTQIRNARLLYYFLIVLVILLFVKFYADFYRLKIKQVANSYTNENFDEFIIEPRLQVQNNEGFQYIEAKSGTVDESEGYTFEDVKLTGDYGKITSGKLRISNDKKTWDFTVKPKFMIYVDNFNKEEQ